MKPKILLVEDDPSVHAALAAVLREEGYDVLPAFNGFQALLAYQMNGDIRLVLLDLNLPDECGWETFERLTRCSPLLPIVIITARSDQDALAESAGAAALMEKPLNLPLLLEIIERLIAGTPPDGLVSFSAGGSRGFFFEGRPGDAAGPNSREKETTKGHE